MPAPERFPRIYAPVRTPKRNEPDFLVQGFGRFVLLAASLGIGVGGLVMLLGSRLAAVTLVGGQQNVAVDAMLGSGRLDNIATLITLVLALAGGLGMAIGILLFVLFVLDLVGDAGQRA